MLISIIIPVYNRPDEIYELLSSLDKQNQKDFEIIIVEDGSLSKCDHIVRDFSSRLNIQYFYKTNGGPAAARNYGAQESRGEYLIFLDSDCIVPEEYMDEVEKELSRQQTDAFGGPDRSHTSFSPLQKAIDYSMTSTLTTGGIRGQKKSADKFYPRSFNMGISKAAFDRLHGFSDMRFGEDIDLSYRLVKNGYSCRLFPDAWVYHKRRSTFKQFFKQVFNSGIARIHLTKQHPGTLKLVHTLPAIFTIGSIATLLLSIFYPALLCLFLLFAIIIFIHAFLAKKNIAVGALSVLSSFIQLTGYGSGFIVGWWKICIRKEKKYAAFTRVFYK